MEQQYIKFLGKKKKKKEIQNGLKTGPKVRVLIN